MEAEFPMHYGVHATAWKKRAESLREKSKSAGGASMPPPMGGRLEISPKKHKGTGGPSAASATGGHPEPTIARKPDGNISSGGPGRPRPAGKSSEDGVPGTLSSCGRKYALTAKLSAKAWRICIGKGNVIKDGHEMMFADIEDRDAMDEVIAFADSVYDKVTTTLASGHDVCINCKAGKSRSVAMHLYLLCKMHTVTGLVQRIKQCKDNNFGDLRQHVC
jgi:protein-tyrosine phosphatase